MMLVVGLQYLTHWQVLYLLLFYMHPKFIWNKAKTPHYVRFGLFAI